MLISHQGKRCLGQSQNSTIISVSCTVSGQPTNSCQRRTAAAMGIFKRYIETEQILFHMIHIIGTATGGDLEKLMTDPCERPLRDGCSAPVGPHPCWPGCSQTSEELLQHTRFRGSDSELLTSSQVTWAPSQLWGHRTSLLDGLSRQRMLHSSST